MTIVQDGDPVLRRKAEKVAASEFNTPELQKEIEAMAAALDKEPDGVAIAAPQIGIGKRIFLVRFDRMIPLYPEEPPREPELGIFINPEIIRSSRRRVPSDEGCLSVRGIYGKTERHERTTVRAYDIDGKPFVRGGGGLLAQAFQHEIDHLNGILFIDHATEMRTVPPIA